MKVLERIDAVLIDGLKIGRFINFAAPVVVLVAAGAVWFAVAKVESVVDAGGQAYVLSAAQREPLVLSKQALGAAEYADVARTFSNLSPTNDVVPAKSGKALVIAAKSPEAMPDWLYSLSILSSVRDGVVWKATTLCLKKCEGGAAAYAEVVGYRQVFSR